MKSAPPDLDDLWNRFTPREQKWGFTKEARDRSPVMRGGRKEEVDVQDDGFPIFSVDKPGWWWVLHNVNDIYQIENKVDEDTVKDLMKELGFGYPGGPDRAANLENPVTSYSGGWKMKMQLCAAQLVKRRCLDA